MVTTFVKFHERKIARRGPANPHMPGLRRPQTRQTGASAFVSRPQEGQRIDPDVLRNIGVPGGSHSVAALIEPRTEIDAAAGRRAKGPVRIGVDGLAVHPSLNPTSASKACQLGHLAAAPGRFSLTLIDGVAQSCGDL